MCHMPKNRKLKNKIKPVQELFSVFFSYTLIMTEQDNSKKILHENISFDPYSCIILKSYHSYPLFITCLNELSVLYFCIHTGILEY